MNASESDLVYNRQQRKVRQALPYHVYVHLTRNKHASKPFAIRLHETRTKRYLAALKEMKARLFKQV